MAIIENKLNVVSAPKIVINKYPNYGETVEEIGSELEYEAEVEFLPEVTLGDYTKLKIAKEDVKKATDEEVEKVLTHFQKQAATYEEISGGAAKGDQVEINFEGFLKKVRIDSMCSKNHPLILGEGSLIPGFEEELIDLKKGDKKDFKITFPKDYHSKDFAGKEAEFKIEILAVRKVNLPVQDEKFAERFGHKNMKELKAAVKENIDMEYKHEYQHELESKVIDKIVPLLKANIPNSLIEKEVEKIYADYTDRLGKQGIDAARYLASSKKSVEEFKKDLAPNAERNIKVGLILGKIIEERKLDPNKPESVQKALEYLIKTIVK